MEQTNPSAFVNPHSLANRVLRLCWSMCWWLCFRPTPWFLGAWRTLLLRMWGAKLGHARFAASVRVWAPWRLRAGNSVYVDRDVFLYNPFGIEIEDRVVISFGSVLCTATHDFRQPNYPLTGERIRLDSDVWIAAEAFLLPGTHLRTGTVIAARAVVRGESAPGAIMAGNPAKVVGKR